MRLPELNPNCFLTVTLHYITSFAESNSVAARTITYAVTRGPPIFAGTLQKLIGVQQWLIRDRALNLLKLPLLASVYQLASMTW